MNIDIVILYTVVIQSSCRFTIVMFLSSAASFSNLLPSSMGQH